MNTPPPLVVAIVNTNPDMVRLLRVALERVGFVATVMHIEDIKTGAVDVEGFLRENDPKVVVYDIVPPYDSNWRFLDHLRTTTGFRGRQFVLTTVNIARVRDVVGTDETVYEIVGRDEDIAEVVRAVKEASRSRLARED